MNLNSTNVATLSAEEQRALLAQLLAEEADEMAEEQAYPLSFNQQRLWFLDQLGVGAAYNLPLLLELTGPLNVASLQQALTEIVRRHAILRTTYREVDGQPQQVIDDETAWASQTPGVPLPLLEFQHLSPAAQWAMVTEVSHDEFQRPFDLRQDRMVRAKLLRMATDQHYLVITLHHIAGDGWSIGVFLRELATLYAAFANQQPSPLPELAIQYADYAHWQRTGLQGERLEHLLDYWQKQLAGVPEVLTLPMARPRPAIQSFRGGQLSFTLAVPLTEQLRKLGQQAGTTLYTVLLSAFQVLLARYTGQEDIVIGSPFANRARHELEPLIGFFVNTLVLRADLAGNPTFAEALARVRAVVHAAYVHQEAPFEALVEELVSERSLSHTPLVQILFALQSAPVPLIEQAGLRIRRLTPAAESVRMDLELIIWEVDGALQGTWIYNADLFDAPMIQHMVDHYQVLLSAIVANPQTPIHNLPLLTANERQQLLVDWAGAASLGELVEPSAVQCIHHLFEAQVARTPDAVAVVMPGGQRLLGNEAPVSTLQSLTYHELNVRANQLAHHLQSLGVGPDVPVGICVQRSFEMVIGLLGILKAGGAYVPLDPSFPQERLAYMVADSQVPILLTQQTLRDALPPHQAQVLYLDAPLPTDTGTANPSSGVTTEHLLYIMYTSGSTGRPKGVQLPHRALGNLIQWHQAHPTLGQCARTAQFTPISFDVSCQEIFTTWCTGGALVLLDEETRRDPVELLRFLDEQRIERLYLPFVALQQLAEVAADATPPVALREIITAGEQLQITPALAQLCRQTGAILHNHYGPTESHAVTAYTLGDAEIEDWPLLPPIGRPIANTQVYLLDANLQPVPLGMPGELYIGGVGVARGYLNQPALTEVKFIPNPFGAGTLYRSGDLARWLPTDDDLPPNIEFLGRADHQVKIRGFRIELGEIEAILAHHPAVQEAVVVAREDLPGQKRLVAYVVLDKERGRQGAGESRLVDLADLRGHLQARLPDYMVPAAFVTLETLPLTPSGKVDRKALPAPTVTEMTNADTYVAPSTPIETALAEIWATVLHLDRVGIHDNFFHLGGHSLLATQVVSRISQRYLMPVPLRTLFERPTIAQLASQVEAMLYTKLAELSDEEAMHLLTQMTITNE